MLVFLWQKITSRNLTWLTIHRDHKCCIFRRPLFNKFLYSQANAVKYFLCKLFR